MYIIIPSTVYQPLPVLYKEQYRADTVHRKSHKEQYDTRPRRLAVLRRYGGYAQKRERQDIDRISVAELRAAHRFMARRQHKLRRYRGKYERGIEYAIYEMNIGLMINILVPSNF